MLAKIKELKDAFHSWVGHLSVEELVVNFDLIKSVERIEQLFGALTA